LRILAIRGQNLASLADPFDVDFEAEPLRGSGIFAITGPNGAGKTTLLDAACLALFDRLPRLQDADRGVAMGGTDGDDQIGYDDVRGVLRRGTSAGYAEIDFVAQDAHRYRSRWEVRRARGKPGGTLQPQKITLTDIQTGEVVGDKKTDTLQQIEQRIGLTFDQFRRSVLLAQGDFDSFIRATSKDRADLLERITGTEIYSKISRAAHARLKRENDALHDLETQLGEHRLLDAEGLAAAQQRAETAKSMLDHVDSQRMNLNKAREWYKAKAQIDALGAESQASLTQAQEVDLAAEADRTAVAAARKALLLRAELEAASASSARLISAEQKLGEAAEAERKAIEARDKAALVSAAAKTAHNEASSAYAAIGLELDKAKHLDTLIKAAQDDLARQHRLLDERVLGRDGARKVAEAAEDDLSLARQDLENAIQWLETRRSVEPMSARIDDVVLDISQQISLKRDVISTGEAVQLNKRQASIAEASRQEKETKVAALKQRDSELGERLRSYRKIAAEVDKEAAAAKRDAIVRIQAAFKSARDASDQARKARQGITSEDLEKARQESLIRDSSDTVIRIDAELPALAARLEEARHNLELSEAAGSEAAQHLRLRLQRGQPCPVCGATEHPVTDVDRFLRKREEADRKRVKELEAALSSSHQGRTRAETQIRAAEDALRGISKRRSAFESDFSAAAESRRRSIADIARCGEIAVTAPAFSEDAASLATPEAIDAFQAALTGVFEKVTEAIRHVSEAESKARKVSEGLEEVRASLESEGANLTRLANQEHSKGGEAKALSIKLEGLEDSLRVVSLRLDSLLSPIFPDWGKEIS
jgi:exonuclease SbcC